MIEIRKSSTLSLTKDMHPHVSKYNSFNLRNLDNTRKYLSNQKHSNKILMDLEINNLPRSRVLH